MTEDIQVDYGDCTRGPWNKERRKVFKELVEANQIFFTEFEGLELPGIHYSLHLKRKLFAVRWDHGIMFYEWDRFNQLRFLYMVSV